MRRSVFVDQNKRERWGLWLVGLYQIRVAVTSVQPGELQSPSIIPGIFFFARCLGAFCNIMYFTIQTFYIPTKSRESLALGLSHSFLSMIDSSVVCAVGVEVGKLHHFFDDACL